MTRYPNTYFVTLKEIHRIYKVDPNTDPLGANLLFKSLQGAYFHRNEQLVNGILLGDISPETRYKSKAFMKLMSGKIEGDYYLDIYIPIWEKIFYFFIEGMKEQIYTAETVKRIKENLKSARIRFTFTIEDEEGLNQKQDPLGVVRYKEGSKEIDLAIYLHQIVSAYVDKILSSGNANLTQKNIFISVLLHELAHLVSLGTFDIDSANKHNHNMNELRGMNPNEISSKDILSEATFRSGYMYSFSDLYTTEDIRSINEAITELIAAEWYNMFQKETNLIPNDAEYHIVYTQEVAAFRKVLQEFADRTGQDYDVVFTVIKNGYISGGESLSVAIDTVLDHLIDPFNRLLEAKE